MPAGHPLALLGPQRRALPRVPACLEHRRVTALLALFVFVLGGALDYADAVVGLFTATLRADAGRPRGGGAR
mgnify:CR=1 FL=1